MVRAGMKLDRRFESQARRAFEKYTLEVGIIEDKPHFQAAKKKKLNVEGFSHHSQELARKHVEQSNKKTVAGGTALKVSRRQGKITVAQLSRNLRKRLGINFYTEPFRNPLSPDIQRLTKAFFLLALRGKNSKRVTSLLQAVVRNPILRGAYGKNSAAVAKEKGSNRLLINTGQLFRAIKARIVVRRVP